MSSDKAPEKVYAIKQDDGFGYYVSKKINSDQPHITYIRADLTLDAKLQKPGSIIEYETEKQLEEVRKTVGGNIKDMERRREMFEKVAFASIRNGSFTWEEIESQSSELIRRADKFARGDK